MSNRAHTATDYARVIARRNPALYAALAYAGLSLVGAIALMLPLTHEANLAKAVGFIDALFISTSAVSTTGLVTLDPGTTFNLAGEIVILVLLQIGGVGFMTLMSFAYLVMRDRLSSAQRSLTRAGFGLSSAFDVATFVRQVVIYTLVLETIGAIALAWMFASAGVADPVWNGIFHSVSAFCTAGFSLYATSLEGFRDNPGILLVVAALSYAGAMGFVVVAEMAEWMTRRKPSLAPTTKLIVLVSAGLCVLGTGFLYVFEPTIAALPAEQRLTNAFFQAMTASTTVGFNSVPIGALAPASIIFLYLLMFVGASPSGTGGGLKTTTVAVLVATAWASAMGRDAVVTAGVRIPPVRVQQATSTLVIGLLVVFTALIALDLTGNHAFDKALFEIFSALGTVGLSMGITGELNDAGKLIITAVMFIGRVGILSFFVAFALAVRSDGDVERVERDVIL
ncbi:MAG: potassium transporter TrkG [Hyphomicrobiaceae bacterium]|nr:potassium transporter TrkG [Hyphomicrobiaceae bacterium]